mgnify:CR=1 FL=1
MFALIAYLMLALGISFLCSILEAALLSMPPSFVRQQERSGSKTGRRLGELKRNIDRSLAAILTLNTVAHTVGAAGVGSQAVKVFGDAYFGVISAVLTVLILVLSEIIPKTLGAQHWRSLVGFTVHSCRIVIFSTYPLVALSKHITDLLQSRGQKEGSVSRDEIVALAQIGQHEGVLEESESRIIRNLIRFRDVRVENIMTPRIVLGALPENASCREAIEQKQAIRFTRIPLYSENKDDITGYVLKSDILQKLAGGEPETRLAEIRRPLRIVSELDTLSKLFDELLTHHEQIALVVDEYGGTSGIVSLEDVIETMIGLEIVDESDSAIDMRELARKRWNQRAKEIGLLEDAEND